MFPCANCRHGYPKTSTDCFVSRAGNCHVLWELRIFRLPALGIWPFPTASQLLRHRRRRQARPIEGYCGHKGSCAVTAKGAFRLRTSQGICPGQYRDWKTGAFREPTCGRHLGKVSLRQWREAPSSTKLADKDKATAHTIGRAKLFLLTFGSATNLGCVAGNSGWSSYLRHWSRWSRQ